MRDMWIMRIPYSRLQPLLTQPVHIVFSGGGRHFCFGGLAAKSADIFLRYVMSSAQEACTSYFFESQR